MFSLLKRSEDMKKVSVIFVVAAVFAVACDGWEGTQGCGEETGDAGIEAVETSAPLSFEIALDGDFEEVCDSEAGLCWSKPISVEYWPYRWTVTIDQPDVPFLEEIKCPDYMGSEWRLATDEEYYGAATNCVFGYYDAVQNVECNYDPHSDTCKKPIPCKGYGDFNDLRFCRRVLDHMYFQIICNLTGNDFGDEHRGYGGYARCIRPI
jgi:hypothetical protein